MMVQYTIMDAAPIIARRRVPFVETEPETFVELVAWKVATPVPPCDHDYKYSFVYIQSGKCILRYDNERGKGDHRHYGTEETALAFTTIDNLVRRFVTEVKSIRSKKP